MKIINLIYIYFITNIQSRRLYSCRSQHSLTCVSLDFPINGFYEITNCDLLKNTFNSFVVEHNFFCNNMNQTYKESLCLNIDNLKTDCFVNIGTSINSLYEKKKEICSLYNTIFNMSQKEFSNITNYCNITENLDDSGLYSILIAFGIIICSCFCCCCLCYKTHVNIQRNYRKERMRQILSIREIY